jgi:hypothetical protein
MQLRKALHQGMTVTIVVIGHLSFEIFHLSFLEVGNIKLKTDVRSPKTIFLMTNEKSQMINDQ